MRNLELPFFLKHRLLLIGLMAACVLGSPHLGVQWNSNRNLQSKSLNNPRLTMNMRSWPRSKSSTRQTPKTSDEQTFEQVDGAVKAIQLRLKEWRQQITDDLFFMKDRGQPKSLSKEEPIEWHLKYGGRILSGVRRLLGGMLHVLRNYGIIYALESIGTEVIHTPLKLFLYHGANHFPGLYRQLRNGLVSCSSHFDCLATSVEGVLIVLFPMLLLQRFTVKDRGIQAAATSTVRINTRLVGAVLVAPIFEEFIYRFLFRQAWVRAVQVKKWLTERFMKNRQAGNIATEQKHAEPDATLESWILPSSLLFGFAHVSNWMPLDRKYFWDEVLIFLRLVGREDIHRYPMRRRSEARLLCSVYQQQHALVLSLICFVPVYQHFGMMGSIGSHSMLNLIAYCIPSHRYLLALFSMMAFTRTSRV